MSTNHVLGESIVAASCIYYKWCKTCYDFLQQYIPELQGFYWHFWKTSRSLRLCIWAPWVEQVMMIVCGSLWIMYMIVRNVNLSSCDVWLAHCAVVFLVLLNYWTDICKIYQIFRVSPSTKTQFNKIMIDCGFLWFEVSKLGNLSITWIRSI